MHNPRPPTSATSEKNRELRVSVSDLAECLVFRAGEEVNLEAEKEERELVYQGTLAQSYSSSQEDSDRLLAVLLDHSLLLLRPRGDTAKFDVCYRPIPIEFLTVSMSRNPQQFSKVTETLKRMACVVPTPPDEADQGFPVTFACLGRKAFHVSLWATSLDDQQRWVRSVQKQQEAMEDVQHVFDSQYFSLGGKIVSCATLFDQGRQIVYGTTNGVYLSEVAEPHNQLIKILALNDVTQVDVLEEPQILIVLSEGQLLTFPLDVLDLNDPNAALERAKRVASYVSFCKAGTCLGRMMLCAVKSTILSTTIKIFEPVSNTGTTGPSRPMFRRLLQGNQYDNDRLMNLTKEFYIPKQTNAAIFLKTKLCLGCAGDFEVVDIETLDIQTLLDPSDQSLDFVRSRKVLQAIALYRIGDNFLMCYDEFAFYVNRTGCRSNKHFLVFWEGTPTAFALQYPYILAFDPTFVEIWHVETGRIVQVIQGSNIRCLWPGATPFQFDPAHPYGAQSGVLVVSDEQVVKLQASARTP
ncbi:uncharacterized protein PHACADRAFT_199441 [Phanerochaete carnosa HHB-10118-sp]|uniref:CNH domain-containing protein n=1 Tax=Phanerochaete carnosa (strain HHB-10118-sp) TaxID=650164 RepID=K5WNP3_PHACS|nr:uncharacterized protein PHACADRAFT_199441 [Phanerochaete carnosa HHB-10118-sp]EKM51937.1 hypothetical protein PHACADRAFT_199441 [Phanerochaete carnosa HHB-10118-sp]